jgi:hypothetical protein
MSMISTRSVLAVLVALLALGVALHGDAPKGSPAAIADRAQSGPLVGALSDEELGKFAVVEMGEALGRVAGAQTSRGAAQ